MGVLTPPKELQGAESLFTYRNGVHSDEALCLDWLAEGSGKKPRLAENYAAAYTMTAVKWYEDENGVLQVAPAASYAEEYSS